MNFTEAAVEVLRREGKPLHYKKITELAIEQNLLSHVGKTPEVTMSSRLATMVKKDRGDAPIVKVGPGVFGLRDGSVSSRGAEMERSPDRTEDSYGASPGEEEPVADAVNRKLPGQEMFPEEEGDDEPIFGGADDESEGAAKEERGADDEGGGRGRRRRRRRRRRGRGDQAEGDNGPPNPAQGSNRRDERPRNGQQPRGRSDEPAWVDAFPPAVTMTRADHLDVLGPDLADAAFDALESLGAASAFERIAETLIRRGVASGEPRMLAPLIAAALRADNARSEQQRMRPRFDVSRGRVQLSDWDLPRGALRAEHDAVQAASRQREQVRRSFLSRLMGMPAVGFTEIVSTWLTSEELVGLRTVRTDAGISAELQMIGARRNAQDQSRVGVLVWRSARDLGREDVMQVRGALHHYAGASVAWLVTMGHVLSGAREEAGAPGLSPVRLVDGIGLARALERADIGIKRYWIPVDAMDHSLLEALGATAESRRGGGEFQRERGDGGRRGRMEPVRDEPGRADEVAAVQADAMDVSGDDLSAEPADQEPPSDETLAQPGRQTIEIHQDDDREAISELGDREARLDEVEGDEEDEGEDEWSGDFER